MWAAITPPGGQVLGVDLEGLAGEQMGGNGVAAEGVQHQDVELPLRRLALQREPAVAHANLDRRPAPAGVAQIGEILAVVGQLFDRRIDLVEAIAVALAGVSGDGAAPSPTTPTRMVGLCFCRCMMVRPTPLS